MINIGKVVYTLLTGTTITNYVGNKIFPIVCPQNTTLPYITYDRSFSNEKVSNISNSTININVFSDDYKESIDITLAVDDIFNGYSGELNNITINDTFLVSGEDNLFGDIFVQTVTYTLICR